MQKRKRNSRSNLSIKERIVQEAVRLLTLVETKYLIEFDGKELSNYLYEEKAADSKTNGRRDRRVRPDSEALQLPSGYLNQLAETVSDGEIHTVVPPRGVTPQYLRGRLTGVIARVNGPGTYCTSLSGDRKSFEIIVTASNNPFSSHD